MNTVVYDGSFAGLLTAVFNVFEYKYKNAVILPKTQRQDSLFGDTHIVHTDDAKTLRIWNGLKKHISEEACKKLYHTYLSEQVGMENMLLHYMQYAFSLKDSIETDYSHPAVLYVNQTARKVHREKHRMEAFVRFAKTKDNIYFATVEPDFNVLPLIAEHFETRYKSQQWLIYDERRKYGLYFNQKQTATVEFDYDPKALHDPSIVFDEAEMMYQQLWQQYFNSVNIPARKNLKLHIRHMPLRYWKYLTEKKFGVK